MAEQEALWKQQKQRSSTFWVWLLAKLALLFGRQFIYYLLYFIVSYYYLFAPSARKASRQALEKFTGKKVNRLAVLRHLHKFAMVSVDRIYLLAGKHQKLDIHLHGEQVFDQYQASKQGCILLVSHVGSFDAMRILADQHTDIKMNIILDKSHNSVVMQLINALNPAMESQIIDANLPAPQMALQLEECLKRGDMLGIMADRANGQEATVNVDFAGAKAALPTSPWMISWVLNAPIILCVGLYKGGNRYDVHFEQLSTGLKGTRKARQQDIEQAIINFAQRLEFYVKQSPDNWFNFYPFWHESTTNH